MPKKSPCNIKYEHLDNQAGRGTTSINCKRPPSTPSSLAKRFQQQISLSVASSPLQVFFFLFLLFVWSVFPLIIQMLLSSIIPWFSQFLTSASRLLFPITMEVTSRNKRSSVKVYMLCLFSITSFYNGCIPFSSKIDFFKNVIF